VKLLAIMRPCPGVDVAASLPRHAEAELRTVWGLYRAGLVRELYSPAGPGAVMVLEAGSAEDGRQTLAELPLLANGVMELELLELRPFVALQMLFASATEGKR
jgi:hypothetical protein